MRYRQEHGKDTVDLHLNAKMLASTRNLTVKKIYNFTNITWTKILPLSPPLLRLATPFDVNFSFFLILKYNMNTKPAKLEAVSALIRSAVR